MTTTEAPPKTKPARRRARQRDMEGTDAFTCPAEPDESMSVNMESFSSIARLILRLAMDEQGLYPGKLVSTIRNGRTKIVAPRYEISMFVGKLDDPKIVVLFHVKRFVFGSKPEYIYKVDVTRYINHATGEVYEIPVCEADQCGAYANVYGANGDIRYCCHCEAVNLVWEEARDGAEREQVEATEANSLPLPVALIASQEAASSSFCRECGGREWVPSARHSGTEPCPSCQIYTYDPPHFHPDDYHDDDFKGYQPVPADNSRRVSDAVRFADYGD